MTLFDDDEPATRPLTRDELVKAYIQELKERPPTDWFAGDTPVADKRRWTAAEKDVSRVYAAAQRLGCALQLVPLKKEGDGA